MSVSPLFESLDWTGFSVYGWVDTEGFVSGRVGDCLSTEGLPGVVPGCRVDVTEVKVKYLSSNVPMRNEVLCPSP